MSAKDDTADEVEEVYWLIKKGEMPRTQENAERVKNAWVAIVQWDALLREAGLQWLPDPEGIFTPGIGDKALEDWIVDAYAGKQKSAEQCREELLKIKEKILQAS